MFDWGNYLILAEELVIKDDEQSKRTAISRAYYSSFGYAKKFLDSKNFSYSDRTSVHSAVWNSLKNSGGPNRGQIFILGDRLRKRRTDADYEPKISGLKSIARKSIEDAKQLNELILSLK